MERIRLIRDKAQLDGTCYFELLPGRYQGRCWNDGFVFLAEDVFGMIEPLIAALEPSFDHYAFVGIHRATWEQIIVALGRLAEQVRNAREIDYLPGEVGFLFEPTRKEFSENFRGNADALASMVTELICWLRDQLREHDYVSILGI